MAKLWRICIFLQSLLQQDSLNTEVKFTLDHLQGIFIIFIILILASIVSFIIELYLFDARKAGRVFKKKGQKKEIIKLRKLKNKNYRHYV